MQAHYQKAIRTSFIAHADEDDPKLAAKLQEHALRDAQWVLDKYGSSTTAAETAAPR